MGRSRVNGPRSNRGHTRRFRLLRNGRDNKRRCKRRHARRGQLLSRNDQKFHRRPTAAWRALGTRIRTHKNPARMPKLPNFTQRSAESDRDAEFLLAEKHDRAMPAAANLDEKTLNSLEGWPKWQCCPGLHEEHAGTQNAEAKKKTQRTAESERVHKQEEHDTRGTRSRTR